MKKLLVLILALGALFVARADGYKVLFIGNSYTEVNNLPQLVANVAASAGDHLDFSSHTPGGCTFSQHLSSAMPYIRQGGWDYVVLQEQSQLPSFPYSQFMAQSYPYAAQLCDSIRAYNPDAVIVFYMTWGRKNGDQQNCQYYPPLCTYEGMDSLLHARYMMMAEDNQAVVSPVGHVWHYIRDHHPDIELYSSDESHPSLAGSYAAACTFYATLFHKSPGQITTDEGLSNEMASNIRSAATLLVYDSLAQWSFLANSDTTPEIPDDTVSIAEHFLQQMIVYPNPVGDVLNITFRIALSPSAEISVFDMGGQCLLKAPHVNMKEVALPVSHLPQGVYFIQVIDGDRKFPTQKFIKAGE